MNPTESHWASSVATILMSFLLFWQLGHLPGAEMISNKKKCNSSTFQSLQLVLVPLSTGAPWERGEQRTVTKDTVKRVNFKRSIVRWTWKLNKHTQLVLFSIIFFSEQHQGLCHIPVINFTHTGPQCSPNFYSSLTCSVRDLIKTISYYLYVCA